MQRTSVFLLATLVCAPCLAETQEVDIDLDAEEEKEGRGSLDDSAGKGEEEEEGHTMAYEDEEAHLAEDEEEAARKRAEEEEANTPGFFERQKVRLGLRFGYALPLGNAGWPSENTSLPLSNVYSGLIPLELDIGYRLSDRITLGIAFAYGFPSVVCESDDPAVTGALDCSGSDVRLELQGRYDLDPLDIGPIKKTVPWFGVGIGYEWASARIIGQQQDTRFSFSGFEFANLQGGVDVPIVAALTLGPFLSFSVGQYSNRSTNVVANGTERNDDTPFPEKAFHMWLSFGIKAEYTL